MIVAFKKEIKTTDTSVFLFCVSYRRMHEFNKPYKCKYCTYDAVQSSTLRKHIQIRHKEYCRYLCITCKDFYCQEEATLAAHLDKKHGTTRRKSIDAYLNPHYMDDSNVVVKEYVQTRGRPRANKGIPPANQQFGTSYGHQSQDALPSQVPLNVKQEPGSPGFSSSLQTATSPTYSTHQINYKSPTQAFSNNSITSPYNVNNTSQPFASSSNAPSFPPHQSDNLVSPTGHNSTTESVENDMVDFSSLTGEYKCNQCAFQTSEEQAFMNHLVTNHSGTAVVDPNGLNSNQSVQNGNKNSISGQTENPFSVTESQDDDACYERDLPTEKDISDLQMGVSGTVKPNYSSPLSTSLSSPIQSDVASTDHQNPNLTPSPSTSRLNDNTLSPATSKDSTITPREAVVSPGGHSTLTRRSYRCRHCDIIFPDNILYAIHRGAHGFHQPFQCNLCGQDCGNKYNFASHLQGCAL